MNNEYYSGLPIELWDNLLYEAEDLLMTDQLGNHLVGIFPAGKRIYGIESEPEGLMCLYVDAVESLLDPIRDYNSYVKYYSGLSNSPILFIELNYWVRCLIKYYKNTVIVDQRNFDWFDLIPTRADSFHVESTIEPLLSLVADFTRLNKIVPKNLGGYNCVHSLLYKRALAIWKTFGRFAPNINPDHGEVFNYGASLTTQIEEYEKSIISSILKNEIPDKEAFSKYNHELNESLFDFTPQMYQTEIEQEMREEVIKIYKSII